MGTEHKSKHDNKLRHLLVLPLLWKNEKVSITKESHSKSTKDAATLRKQDMGV